MRQLIFLFLIVVFSFSCNSGRNGLRSDLEMANLKGRVWKIEKTVHDTKESCNCPASMRSDSKRSLIVYNENGFLAESSTIGDEGNVLVNSKYSYRKKGVCSEVVRFSGEKIIGKDEIISKGGKVVEVRVFNSDGYRERSYTLKYTEDLISEEQTLNDLGIPVSSVSSVYSEGQLVSQTEKDADGNVITVSRFKRNRNNDVTEYLIEFPNEKRESRFTFEYEYDEAGNWAKQTQFFEGNIMSVVLRNITYFNS